MNKRKVNLQIETNIDENASDASQEFQNSEDSFKQKMSNLFDKISEQKEEQELIQNFKLMTRRSSRRITTKAKDFNKLEMYFDSKAQQTQKNQAYQNINFQQDDQNMIELEITKKIE